MEELPFNALDALSQLGLCVFTTNYGAYHLEITIRNTGQTEQFYNYVFQKENLKENIHTMISQYMENNECDFFSAGMIEKLTEIDLPIIQLPVYEISRLTVEIRALKATDYYSSSPIMTRFSAFRG